MWLVIQVEYKNGAKAHYGSWQVPEGDPCQVPVPRALSESIGDNIFMCFMGDNPAVKMRVAQVSEPHETI
jgi:hypothetical protein